MTKELWLSKNGFNAEGVTFAILEDSFSIKDELKELGFKYSPLLKWHSPEKKELSSPKKYTTLSFDELYIWENHMPYQKEEAKAIIENKIAEMSPYKDSLPMGKVGERLKKIPAVFIEKKGFLGNFGYTYVYSFLVEGNLLTWFSQSTISAKPNSKILLSGTIKSHSTYGGINSTILSRCIITEL